MSLSKSIYPYEIEMPESLEHYKLMTEGTVRTMIDLLFECYGLQGMINKFAETDQLETLDFVWHDVKPSDACVLYYRHIAYFVTANADRIRNLSQNSKKPLKDVLEAEIRRCLEIALLE